MTLFANLRTSLFIGLCAGLCAASAACAAGPMEGQPTGAGGKSDSLDDQRCATAAVDTAGVCRASDGTFAPATCCEESADFAVFECTFDAPSFAIDNSTDLRDFVDSSKTIGLDDYEGLNETEQLQIQAAAVHLSFLSGSSSADELFSFEVTDDEEFIFNAVTVDGDTPFEGDWVKFFAGDTEVGVIFDAGTLEIVAEVSDGDLMDCQAANSRATVSCTFETPAFNVDNSGELTDFIVNSTTIEIGDLATLGQRQKDQILAAAVHLSFIDGSEPFDSIVAADISDDENFILHELVIDTDVEFAGDWVEFFAGDTEVGVVFEAGTTNIVAEVSDGDLMACARN